MTCRFLKYSSDNDLTKHGLLLKDIYQTYAYSALEAERTKTEPWFFLYETEDISIALPVLLSSIPNELSGSKKLFDAKSSYGYPGIVFSEIPSEEQMQDFFSAVLQVASLENIVSIFIRLHPYYNQIKIQNTSSIVQLMHGKTVFTNLKESSEEIVMHYSSSHTRGVKALKQHDFYGRINNWEDYSLFQSAYKETMEHVNAASLYFFEPSYFNALKNSLGSNLHIINVYDKQNQYTTGALFMTYGEFVQYHLGGTFSTYRKMAPSKLVFDIAIHYFAELGFHTLHLGGGVGSSKDSLFEFKKGFGRHTLDFSTVRCIVMQEEYNALVKKQTANVSNTDLNYFPLYRLK